MVWYGMVYLFCQGKCNIILYKMIIIEMSTYILPMKGKHRNFITRSLLYHNDYYVKLNIFKTEQPIAVMVQPMNVINGVNATQERTK